ncbi:hypothetical protein TPA0909_71480 [Streptomyces albus]|nr:hypothetical protein TPA0909_71480 [Streptomyces albus]
MPDESKVTVPSPAARLPVQTVWAVRVVAMVPLSARVVLRVCRSTRSCALATRRAPGDAPGGHSTFTQCDSSLTFRARRGGTV